MLYRARADDLGFGNRTEEDRLICINRFRLVDVRQPRIDEVSHEGIWVISKVLTPNCFNELSSLRRVATLEGPNGPI